ncbi:ABC transporter permease [Telmatospirillum siberiense]|uniref:Glycosyl transferase family 1 n=1 Tax=Telmatospirillum siberiense TaxID=382514 RepID=A0A2N3PT10_9PROT|nr:FtsX-like permease family protein [Telmatospirillum siberiense]PKU23506.1 glycosyl transferase family 1 [Telmatospirillum siberiense]
MNLLPFVLARRELRGSLKGFGVFVACLALGVAAIAGAASLDASLRRSLAEDAQALLGGDVELRLSYRSLKPEEWQFLAESGTISDAVEMRAMLRSADGARQTLVEVKGVDAAYPLYGRVDLQPPQALPAALARQDGPWGAAVDGNLLDRLGAKVGDTVLLGEAKLVVRSVIEHEPDRAAMAFSLGPRLLIDSRVLDETRLLQPGSLVHHTVLVRLRPGLSAALFKERLDRRFPDAGWQFRDAASGAPGIKRFLDQMTLFLTLVGLTALLVGGIGVANGVKTFLDGRMTSIAILKCLGASRRLIQTAYFLQVALLAAAGIALGLAVGATLPWLAAAFLADKLPVAARLGIYPGPLAEAAGFGALTTLAFAIWPLARAAAVPAATLFRDIVAGQRYRPGFATLAAIFTAAAALAALAIVSAADRRLATWFVGGSAAVLVLFLLAGAGLVQATRFCARRLGAGGAPAWRLGLSSLYRPGAPTRGVVLSLGLGLTLLVMIALVQANLNRQFDERIPAQAPSFFFIDIQPDQAALFDQAVAGAGADAKRATMVRGRITRIDGVPVEQVAIAPDAQWAVRGDRGLSTAATPPEGARVVAGAWWPADYDGPPLVSLDAGIAKGFGLTVGQTITVNVLGREITARIANLREIDWSSLSMNFTFILTPQALAGAPATYIATVHAPAGRENAVERAVTTALPNVSSIRVKEALETIRQVVGNAGMAIRGAAMVTLLAGALVLAGAIAAGRQRRIRETVLLKVLGAGRGDLLRALLLEFMLLGVVAAVLAAALGSVAAWAVLVFVLKTDWIFLPLPVAATALGGVLGVTLFGMAGTLRVLAAKPAPYLRHD